MILIDVRTKEEYETGYIDGAINHDIMDMMSGVFPDIDKEEDISIYCQSGNRSMMAKQFMNNAKFNKVTDLGIIDNLR
jgi:phage shock protein E